MNVFVLAAGRVLRRVRAPPARRRAATSVRAVRRRSTSFVAACRAAPPAPSLVPRASPATTADDIVAAPAPRRPHGGAGRRSPVVLVSPDAGDARRRPPRRRRLSARAVLRRRAARRRRRGHARPQAHPARRRLGAHPPPHRADPRGGRLRRGLAPSTAPRRSSSSTSAQPDLVITDVEMPKLDGYAVCKAIKERAPPARCADAGHHLLVARRGHRSRARLRRRRRRLPGQAGRRPTSWSSRIRALVSTFGLDAGQRETHPRRRRLAGHPPLRRRLPRAPGLRRHRRRRRPGRARARAATSRFDMVVTDYDMPRMTGFELVHALRRDPELRDIPVVMLTARDTRRDQAQMRAAGADQLPGQAVLASTSASRSSSACSPSAASSPTRRPRASTSATARVRAAEERARDRRPRRRARRGARRWPCCSPTSPASPP